MTASEHSKTIYLKDYLPTEYQINEVELDFELNPDVTTVKSQLKISKNP